MDLRLTTLISFIVDNINQADERNTAYNSTYKKLTVQLLNEASCFVLSSVLADSFTLRNRQLLKPAKRSWTTTQSPNTPGNICK